MDIENKLYGIIERFTGQRSVCPENVGDFLRSLFSNSQFSEKDILYLVSTWKFIEYHLLDLSEYKQFKHEQANQVTAILKNLQKCENDLANSHYKPQRECTVPNISIPYNFGQVSYCE